MFLITPIRNSIKNADLFGSQIALSYNQSPLYKSFMGGVLSVILLAFFLALCLQNLIAILTKTPIIPITSENYESEPPNIDLSPSKINWAIGLNPLELTRKRLFNIEVYQVHNYRDLKGNLVKEKNLMELKKCEINDFSMDFHENLLKLTNNISNLLCPYSNNSYNVEGRFSSARFSFVLFKLSQCVNISELNQTDCASEEEIDEQFKINLNKINLQVLIYSYFIKKK